MTGNKRDIEDSYANIKMSNSSITIESGSITELDVDLLVIFADKPEAVLNNQFIKDLNTSIKIILEERIKDKSKVGNHEFCIKISDPFF